MTHSFIEFHCEVISVVLWIFIARLILFYDDSLIAC